MRLIADPAEFQATMLGYRSRGLRVGFVPTMGYLHVGHTTLMAEAGKSCDVVAVSIFVNPKQFGPNEDLARYPRDLPGDLDKCRAAGVDVVFAPQPETLYPADFETKVSVAETSQGYDGAARPGHFDGVTTVVLKLFLLAQPHAAFFGEKDFQQLAVIRAMVRDLSLPLSVVGVPTVREVDGLAMSSRNVFLSAEDRKEALVLKRALEAMRDAASKGERKADVLLERAREVVAAVPSARIDYVSLADVETLKAPETLSRPTQGLIAVFFGKTRLIDNLLILA